MAVYSAPEGLAGYRRDRAGSSEKGRSDSQTETKVAAPGATFRGREERFGKRHIRSQPLFEKNNLSYSTFCIIITFMFGMLV